MNCVLGQPLREMEISESVVSDESEHKYDSQSAQIEAWLDEHPDFANDYFIR